MLFLFPLLYFLQTPSYKCMDKIKKYISISIFLSILLFIIILLTIIFLDNNEPFKESTVILSVLEKNIDLISKYIPHKLPKINDGWQLNNYNYTILMIDKSNVDTFDRDTFDRDTFNRGNNYSGIKELLDSICILDNVYKCGFYLLSENSSFHLKGSFKTTYYLPLSTKNSYITSGEFEIHKLINGKGVILNHELYDYYFFSENNNDDTQIIFFIDFIDFIR